MVGLQANGARDRSRYTDRESIDAEAGSAVAFGQPPGNASSAPPVRSQTDLKMEQPLRPSDASMNVILTRLGATVGASNPCKQGLGHRLHATAGLAPGICTLPPSSTKPVSRELPRASQHAGRTIYARVEPRRARVRGGTCRSAGTFMAVRATKEGLMPANMLVRDPARRPSEAGGKLVHGPQSDNITPRSHTAPSLRCFSECLGRLHRWAPPTSGRRRGYVSECAPTSADGSGARPHAWPQAATTDAQRFVLNTASPRPHLRMADFSRPALRSRSRAK